MISLAGMYCVLMDLDYNASNVYKMEEPNKLVPLKGVPDDTHAYFSLQYDTLYIMNKQYMVIAQLKYLKERAEAYSNEYHFFEGQTFDGHKNALICSARRSGIWLNSTRFMMHKDIKSGLIQVGPHTYGTFSIAAINPNGKIVIGDYSQFGNDVKVFLANHRTDLVSTFPFDELNYYYSDIKVENSAHCAKNGDAVTIGNDVWIGDDVSIMPGINIGDGAVIGTGAVVTHDVPDYAIVAGVPAKVIKYRFSEDQIAKLKKIAWWSWSDDQVAANINKITNPDIDAFIREFYK